MPHPVLVCPDALLHHAKLALPQLLVHLDGLGLDKVLGGHLYPALVGQHLFAQQELLPPLFATTQQFP